MSVFDWQDYLYPFLMVEHFLLSVLLFTTYYWLERLPAILVLSIVFAVQGVAFSVLTITIGNNPMLDINEFRIWIIYVRVILAVVMIPALHYQAKRVWKYH